MSHIRLDQVRTESVYGVVPTYLRDRNLEQYIEACQNQTHPVDKIVVVDNGRSDSTRSLCQQASNIVYIRSNSNIGPWAAHAVGMKYAVDDGADLTWHSDDDSIPVPHALHRLLIALRQNLTCAAIGSDGGDFSLLPKHWKRGQATGQFIDNAQNVRAAGFLELDGTLWQANVIHEVGLPRNDYFMGIGGMEYSLRVLRHGYKLGLIDEHLTEKLHLGSGGTGAPGAPWRSYYQTRNHLAMAIQHRSPKLLLGWVIRHAFLVSGSTIHTRVNRFEKLLWRLRGTRDALLGRMGNRVDPTSYCKSKYL